MKVFLTGRDRVGWVMDEEWKYTEMFLMDIGHTVTSNFLRADVIHSVWWSSLLNSKLYPLRWKKIIAFATNEIGTNSPEFLKAKKFVNVWIAPSRVMYNKLKLAGVDVKYQPFYADEKIFYKINKSREEIAQELGINYELFRDKLVIGSFQRDSLGADLTKPKWQKGPELLVNILSELPKDKFFLLLGGPRRHWVINQCRGLDIPYLYYGREPNGLEDDIKFNTLDKQTMNELYNLTDLYVVSSRSEGGPKAVLESPFTKTMILSTDVGLASDFLHPGCIYKTTEEAVQKIKEMMKGKDCSNFIKFNYEKADSIASYKPMLNRWREIYEYFKNVYIT
jgi:hypothetical protein